MTQASSRCDPEAVRRFCLKNFLPLGFLGALIVALSWPEAGIKVSEPEVGDFRLVQTINVITIFVISGLTLKTDDVVKAFSKEGRAAYGYGTLSILVITACFGFIAVEIPFAVDEFSYGLAVFCVVPTTLTSGVALVVQGGGNGALALLLVVTTNLLGVITVPLWVKAVLGAGGASIDAVDLLVKLVISVLVPLVIGKVIRETAPGIKPLITNHKVKLSLVSNFSLILVVWQSLSRAEEDLTSTSFVNILAVVAAGVILHLAFLAVNWPLASRVLRLEPAQFKAVVILTSQKTLPVSVTVIGYLTAIGSEGLMTIPCIVGHMAQLFMDAYIVGRWHDRHVEETKTAAAAEGAGAGAGAGAGGASATAGGETKGGGEETPSDLAGLEGGEAGAGGGSAVGEGAVEGMVAGALSDEKRPEQASV